MSEDSKNKVEESFEELLKDFQKDIQSKQKDSYQRARNRSLTWTLIPMVAIASFLAAGFWYFGKLKGITETEVKLTNALNTINELTANIQKNSDSVYLIAQTNEELLSKLNITITNISDRNLSINLLEASFIGMGEWNQSNGVSQLMTIISLIGQAEIAAASGQSELARKLYSDARNLNTDFDGSFFAFSFDIGDYINFRLRQIYSISKDH